MKQQKILIIGLGSLGGLAVKKMIQIVEDKSIGFLIIDSDKTELSQYQNSTMLAGEKLVEGRSCGGNTNAGEEALLEIWPDLQNKIKESGTTLVIFVAGLGRGFSSGAVVELARKLRQLQIMSLALVTQPFIFEGNQVVTAANVALNKLRNLSGMLMPVSLELIQHQMPDKTLGALHEEVVPVLASGLLALIDILKKNTKDLMPLDYSAVLHLIKGRNVECGLFYARNFSIDPEALKIQFFNSALGGGIDFMSQSGNLIIKMTASSNLSKNDVLSCLMSIQNSVPKHVQVLVGLYVDPEMEGVRLGGVFVRQNISVKQEPMKGSLVQLELPLVMQSSGVFAGSKKDYTKDGFDFDQPSFQRKLVKIDTGQVIKRNDFSSEDL